MFIFHIKKFANSIHIDETVAEETKSESPIIIYYNENGKITRHEILRRFYEILKEIKFDWIRPMNTLTGEWLINLKQLKQNFECLKNTAYLKSKITIEPEYIQDISFDLATGKDFVKSTMVKFFIHPEDVINTSIVYDIEIEKELIDPLNNFRKDFPEPKKCCFLMMKFEDTKEQTKIVKVLKEEFKKLGLHLLRVDDKAYCDDLFLNIKTYMHGCSFGLALFERINSNYFNPNVSLEVGYMMALKKPILFLKDKNLDSLHSDLVGKLYYSFDVQNKKSIKPILDKWLNEKEII